MKIIVCVKQIRHTFARSSMDPGENFVGPEDTIHRVNPYDEAALSLAIRVKKLLGSSRIVLVTLGPIIAEDDLRRCLAIGADDLYQITVNGGEDDLDSWSKGAYLARASRELDGDLILCGKESMDSRNGLVGAFIAQRLGLPFVSGISDLVNIGGEDSIKVKRNAARGTREIIECSLPAVFSVDLASSAPEYPAYADLKKAGSVPILGLRFEKGMVKPKTTAVRTFAPCPRPKCVEPPDSSLPAFERVEQLLMGSRVEKKSAFLRGSPESQVDGIMSFLEEHGFLDAKGGEAGDRQ